MASDRPMAIGCGRQSCQSDYDEVMGIRGFFRSLIRGTGTERARPRHSGDELAEEVRDTMGPQGGEGGRGASYRLLEDRKRN